MKEREKEENYEIVLERKRGIEGKGERQKRNEVKEERGKGERDEIK